MPKEKKFPQKKLSDILFIILLILGFALKIYIVYFGYFYYQYIVPPGSDVISHFQLIEALSSGVWSHLSTYPPLFHLIVLYLAKIFHQDVWHILTTWTPMLIILPSLAMFFLLRQLFDTKVSVLATLVLLLTSNYPLYAFVDGNYPDMLAYGLFTVLLFAFVIRYVSSKRRADLIAAIILFFAITLTHHFTFINVFAILLVFSALQLSFYFKNRKTKQNLSKEIKNIAIVGAALLVILLIADKLYGAFVFDFIKGMLTNRPSLQDAYLNSALSYNDYPQVTGGILWYGGILGFICLILSKATTTKEAAAKQLVIIWLLFFYLVSRIASSAVPARFARELALPLTVCLAYLLNYIFNAQNIVIKNYKTILALGLIGYLVFMNSAFFTGLDNLPDSFSWQIWFWPKDQQKLDYLSEKIPKSEPILFNPAANLFMPIKTKNNLVPLNLTPAQADTVTAYLNDRKNENDYKKVLTEVKDQYGNINLLFIDVKPPSNPSGITFSKYAQFEIKDKLLRDLGHDGKVIKKFDDGAELVQI
jgi:hypothetical protein